MTRSSRLTAVFLTAATLAIVGCRSTHTTVVEPVREDPHRDDHRPPPPPPPDHRDDHR